MQTVKRLNKDAGLRIYDATMSNIPNPTNADSSPAKRTIKQESSELTTGGEIEL